MNTVSNNNDKINLKNFPNPANPSTIISFNLPQNAFVKIVVFNILGQEVKTLINERMEKGFKETRFDGSFLPSGVYFYRLNLLDENSNEYSITKKLLLIK